MVSFVVLLLILSNNSKKIEWRSEKYEILDHHFVGAFSISEKFKKLVDSAKMNGKKATEIDLF